MNRYFIAAFGFCAAISQAEAAAKTAHGAGMNIARNRGYPNPRCYASVFENYAVVNRNSKFRPPAGKSEAAFRVELFNKCNISI